jgi:hypothetical protein
MEEEERRCRMCYEEKETIEHMWNGCSEMRERERKELGEMQNEDGREIGWKKEIWKRRTEWKKKGVGNRKVNVVFFGIVIFILDKTVTRNSKAL